MLLLCQLHVTFHHTVLQHSNNTLTYHKMHKKLLTVAGNKVKSCFKKTFHLEQKLEAVFFTYDSVSPKDIQAGQTEIKLHYS